MLPNLRSFEETRSRFPRRVVASREYYWRSLFNDYAMQYQEDHAISGWSSNGLRVRQEQYFRLFAEYHSGQGLILDLGCGSGFYTRTLRGGNHDVVGIDYSFNAVKEATKRDRETGGKYVCGDIYSLPFKDRTFTHVLCIGLFQSLSKSELALAELNRIMTPEAVLIIDTLNWLYLRNLVESSLNRTEYLILDGQRVPRLATYKPPAFKRQLTRIGFEVLGIRPVIVPPPGPLLDEQMLPISEIHSLSALFCVGFVHGCRKEKVEIGSFAAFVFCAIRRHDRSRMPLFC